MRERGGSGMILASSIQLLLHKIFKKYILHDEINNFLKGFQQRSLRNNEKYLKTMILAIDTLHHFFYSKFERTVASPNFIPGRKGT